MTKKPTDAEIKKALKKELKYVLNLQHRLENFGEETPENDKFIALMSNTLHLINRLKAENEALISAQETLQKHIKKAKAEAIKEFAERLKSELLGRLCEYFNYELTNASIDKIAKEMEGDMGV